ncbi:unnamed protein product [Caenorhabditis angaria]|uniref:SSD domain-containing protein n=1 Tax=Caenorhabditis angaria TaxID=860376 RepID=A0A9P1I9F8_9PELO|nr:unnamed protein product [Caenorhabditis angaria]
MVNKTLNAAAHNFDDNEVILFAINNFCLQGDMFWIIGFILRLTIFEAIIYLGITFALFLYIRSYLEKQQIENIKEKAVFITGCDTGFGRDLAIKCLENGMTVFAGCLTQNGINNLKRDSKGGNKLDAFLLNVSENKSCEEAGIYIEKKLAGKPLHAVVNNAGITGKFLKDDFLDIEEYKKVCDINMFGVIRTTHCVKRLIKKSRGRVVTVASICARVGLPGIGPYTTAKYGVSGYCDVLRQELRPFGVSVHILEPGFFETPLIGREKINREVQQAWAEAPPQVREEYGETYFNKSCETINFFLNRVSNKDVYLVVDAYYHAITSKWPRSRYQVGWDSILCFIPFSYLPTGMQDLVFASAAYFLPKPAQC